MRPGTWAIFAIRTLDAGKADAVQQLEEFYRFLFVAVCLQLFFLVKMTQVSLFPTCRTCNLTGNPKCMKMLLMVEIPNNHLECIKPFTSTGKRRISEPSTISWSHYLHIFFG